MIRAAAGLRVIWPDPNDPSTREENSGEAVCRRTNGLSVFNWIHLLCVSRLMMSAQSPSMQMDLFSICWGQ